jgi:Ca2+-transporting ATPase
MRLRPRHRGESILTNGMFVTCGLVGLYMAVANLLLIELGLHHYHSVQIGSSMGLTAFALMLVASAYHCRSERGTILTTDTFNSRNLNLTALAEMIGAVLLTEWNFLNRLLGTTQLTAQQWGAALLAAVILIVVWEAGKWIARGERQRVATVTAEAA